MLGCRRLGPLLDTHWHPWHQSRQHPWGEGDRRLQGASATLVVVVLYAGKEVVFTLHLTSSLSAAGEGRGEGGGQSKAAPGKLINSGCEEQGCGAPG